MKVGRVQRRGRRVSVWRCLQWLDGLSHLLWPVVLIHVVVRRHQLTRSRVLLRRLSDRRAAVIGIVSSVTIIRSRFLADGCGLYVVGWLLVVLVSVLLVHLD